MKSNILSAGVMWGRRERKEFKEKIEENKPYIKMETSFQVEMQVQSIS